MILLLFRPISLDTAILSRILYVNFHVYSLWLWKMGKRLTVETGPEPLAALNGLAQEDNTPSVAIGPVLVPNPPAQVPVLPVPCRSVCNTHAVARI